jgi:hypothetical protein
MDIPQLLGLANADAQDAFCAGGTCTFSILYDQSGKGNHLQVAPAGCYNDGSANLADFESSAVQKSVTVSGHRVYALYTNKREGYRNNTPTGTPVGLSAQSMYMVADGTHSNSGCCWDFGNVSTNNCYTATTAALFFGTGFWDKGLGAGPWFMGDFEGGIWAGGSATTTGNTNANNPSLKIPYAFGILETSSGQYALRMGDATSGALVTAYDGTAPKVWNSGGGIVIGTANDNTNQAIGTFFEGALTAGRPSAATGSAVLQNVQDAKYGQ